MAQAISSKEYFDATSIRTDELVDIGEMARHIGLSPQGLHWYESEGYVSPLRENKYRKYSTDDLCVLSRIRFYRQIGFSSSEIKNLLSMEIDSIAYALNLRVEEMRRELEKEQLKLSIIESKARLAQDFCRLEGRITVAQTEAFYFKHSFKAAYYGKENPASTIKDWAAEVPLAQYLSIMKLDDEGNASPSVIGLQFQEKYLAYAGPVVSGEIAGGGVPLIASERALYGLFQLQLSCATKSFGAILCAAGVDLKLLTGTMIMRPITCRQCDGVVRDDGLGNLVAEDESSGNPAWRDGGFDVAGVAGAAGVAGVEVSAAQAGGHATGSDKAVVSYWEIWLPLK